MILAQTQAHPATGTGTGAVGAAVAAAVVSAAVAYLAAAARLRRRGDAWPRLRDASFTAGSTILVLAMTAPLPGGPFTVHVARHLLTAMAAPLLLALARPLTLTLRALPPGPARRGLLAVAHSRPAAWLLTPPLAAVLDLGGLWLLHRTPLLAAAHHQPVLGAAVHAHVLAAGLLFTSAVCQLDPVRRRWSAAWRGTTLLAAGWAHTVLAGMFYAAPPPGTSFTAADLHTAARLMYYGGDLVEAALAAVLATQWYTATGRVHRRHRLARPAARERRSQPGKALDRALGVSLRQR
ncbi:hypothetical protein GCM10018793_07730 [Streptomyces sulfonofaciens]|uniref:Cytochrome c oxidase assembly protein n=1 Tax=Streptomyces sulfonofaciens TaxID=68272 RepID=A0A919KU33_9ACTN|nr:cytochrome c oxidase assembly protein [Streptomyces sulfonofaciens]GHH71771.1 hypothetical protein GCM10018793_07730 [Streptomyces sulfonofaciens]